MAKPKRVAVMGFMLESNGHAPVATKEEFLANVYFEGEALREELRKDAPRLPPTITGFARAMDASGPWEQVPVVMTAVGASGPVEQGFFEEVCGIMRRRLEAAGRLDGVFLSQHGAATATGDVDPDGTIFRLVREIVGQDVPVVSTLDLHANVSREMVELTDALVAYRTNPHVDMAERGAECAAILRRMMDGMRTATAFVKVPFIPPSVSQLTKSGPYADLIAYGQSKVDKDVVNVSVLSGFSIGDTPKNGMSVIVTTAGDKTKAERLAKDVAGHAWRGRHAWLARLTSIEDATSMAVAAGRGERKPILFADVADNPGGGGRGNTTYILDAFYKAGAEGVLLGIFNDRALAAEAHERGVGAEFNAVFNRDETNELSQLFEAPARVIALGDGRCIGRRGIGAGRSLDVGKSAVVEVGGIRVVVISIRNQCSDPMYFEMLGLDIGKARSVIVKSRGHFRAGFDEFFPDERIVEVDVPGLSTPVAERYPWRWVPRPIFPLDRGMEWSP